MKFVSRTDLGWGPSGSSLMGSAGGVKIHYLGTHVDPSIVDDHRRCLDLWRNIRDSHLANTSERYTDIAYNAGVCQHGYVLEGRGAGRRSGANGNRALNDGDYAVAALLGDSGATDPAPDMLNGLRDAIEWLRSNGAGDRVGGHQDGYPTSCPGKPLYAWVQAGAPRPQETAEQPVTAPPAPQPPVMAAPRFPGRLMAVTSPMLHGDDVRDWQIQMRHRGWTIDTDGWYGPASSRTARQFQQDSTAHGWPLTADGIVGKLTWEAAFRRPIS